jgi:predicted HTH domain antitoxin
MQITVQLPDDLNQCPDAGRTALEAFVIEGYRSGALSEAQAGGLLGLSRIRFEGFLKDRKISEYAYDVKDLDRDWAYAQKDIQRRLDQYTNWLRSFPESKELAIDPTNDKGPFPYQWKICTADYSSFIGYVTFDGPAVAGTETEKRRSLHERLCNELRRTGKL